jgi:hypothetical protein
MVNNGPKCEAIMKPYGKFPLFITVHPQFGFGFLETLLNRPVQSAQLNKRLKSGA